jgi:hypothetical protein
MLKKRPRAEYSVEVSIIKKALNVRFVPEADIVKTGMI